MKIKLDNNRVARITVKFGNEKPALVRPLPEYAQNLPFRSVRMELSIFDNEEKFEANLWSWSCWGISYCSPVDQFNKFEGRKKAMKRLLPDARKYLTKKDLRTLCPIMLHGPLGVPTA